MDKKLVVPGQFLSTEEEFEPGSNTFEEQGQIFSDSLGKPVFDAKQKTVLVQKNREKIPLENGSTVIGKVMLVKSNMVMVELLLAEKNSKPRVIAQSFAVLPARNISRSFVKNLKDFFKTGDLVKAEVAMVTKYSVDLRTNMPELGVIKAFCSNCRSPLVMFHNELKCVSCGHAEQRKLSTEYLLK